MEFIIGRTLILILIDYFLFSLLRFYFSSKFDQKFSSFACTLNIRWFSYKILIHRISKSSNIDWWKREGTRSYSTIIIYVILYDSRVVTLLRAFQLFVHPPIVQLRIIYSYRMTKHNLTVARDHMVSQNPTYLLSLSFSFTLWFVHCRHRLCHRKCRFIVLCITMYVHV